MFLSSKTTNLLFAILFIGFLWLCATGCSSEDDEPTPDNTCTNLPQFDLVSAIQVSTTDGIPFEVITANTVFNVTLSITDDLNNGKPCISASECSNFDDYNNIPSCTVQLKLIDGDGNKIEEVNPTLPGIDKDCGSNTTSFEETYTQFTLPGTGVYYFVAVADSEGNKVNETNENNNRDTLAVRGR